MSCLKTLLYLSLQYANVIDGVNVASRAPSALRGDTNLFCRNLANTPMYSRIHLRLSSLMISYRQNRDIRTGVIRKFGSRSGPRRSRFIQPSPSKMAVPRISQLQSGTAVNIVLKADQRSGKLTTGHIADVLTRGDHPRGIKVRLTNGQIGRVQSLSGSSSPSALQSLATPSNHQGVASQPQNHQATNILAESRRGMVQDVRQDGYDAPSRDQTSSLFDYVRPSKQRKSAAKPSSHDSESQIAPQTRFESEFPKLDSALIAAILADYPTIDEARDVLKGL